MRFLPPYLALACIVVFTALDLLIRLRLRKVGEQTRPFQPDKVSQITKAVSLVGMASLFDLEVWLAGVLLMLLNLLYNTVPRRAGF
jgi:hypothetical protein